MSEAPKIQKEAEQGLSLPRSLWTNPLAEGAPTAPFTQIETIADGLIRLRRGLKFEPYSGDEEALHTTFRANIFSPGKYYMQRQFGDMPADGDIEVGVEDPDYPAMFDRAAEEALRDDILLRGILREEGKWWISSEAEKVIDRGVNEVFQISDGDSDVELVNCAEGKLTDKEKASIVKVFNAVSHFTGGKIFDRISGIALLPNDAFKAGVAGDYQAATGVLRVNAEALREKDDLGRYGDYFKDGQTDWFEIVLAHELGHPMDIHSLDEADAHGLDRDRINWQAFGGFTNDFSSFQELAGWSAIKGGADQIFQTDWQFDTDDELIECVPTEYAGTAPNEDFAETFAISVLKGDVSSLSLRHQKLLETVRKAKGRSSIGPKNVTVEEVNISNGYPKKQIESVAIRLFAGESH